MAVIVVARLRLRDPSLLDEFFTHAVAVIEQAPSAASVMVEPETEQTIGVLLV